MSLSEENWQTTRPTIRERSKFMFNNELLSDVKFVVRDSANSRERVSSSKVIPAHKFILAISSPVFLAMFYGEMAETDDSIELPDCEYEGLLELFRYMYSDEVNLTGSNVMQILYLAKKYIAPSLAEKCTDFLQKNLELSNVFCILSQAQKFEEKDLVDRCWELIDEQTEEALKSEGFVTLERTLVESVVARESLTIGEIELFKAVDRWATRESERQGLTQDGAVKRRILGEKIVKAIRFPLMTVNDFTAIVPDSKILTREEIVNVMNHFNNPLTTPSQFTQTPRLSKIPQRLQRFATCLPPKGLWSYYSDTPDSLCFSVNKPVFLHGVRLFGSKGNAYLVTLEVKVFSGGPSLVETSGSYTSKKHDTDSCYGFDVLFNRPVKLKVDVVYQVVALIQGPNSWYGLGGRKSMECSGLTFTFSVGLGVGSNGTSCSQGQFPGLLFS